MIPLSHPRAQFVQSIAFAFIISTIWWQLGDDQDSVQDRNGVLFFMSANGMMSSIMGVLSTFGNERSTFIRDYENQLYKVGPYLFAKIACEAPFYFVIPLIGATIMYFCVGFQATAAKYVNTAIVMITLNYAGMSMGLILASTFADIAVALLVAPLIIMPLMMFSGFFLNADSTPVYYSWIPWISPMKYAFSALATNEYTGLKLVCQPDEYIDVEINGVVTSICPFEIGEAFLETFNIEKELTIAVCQLSLVAMTGGCIFLSFLALRNLVKRKR